MVFNDASRRRAHNSKLGMLLRSLLNPVQALGSSFSGRLRLCCGGFAALLPEWFMNENACFWGVLWKR